jgi:hypothetical protein
MVRVRERTLPPQTTPSDEHRILLEILGAPDKGLSIGKICKRLVLERACVSKTLVHLQKNGLLWEDDGRWHPVGLDVPGLARLLALLESSPAGVRTQELLDRGLSVPAELLGGWLGVLVDMGMVSRPCADTWALSLSGQHPVSQVGPSLSNGSLSGLPLVNDPGPPLYAQTGMRAMDESQDRVVLAHHSHRFLIEAGPGFGKTDVACARVAHLIEEGVEPETILLLSFTRTAVREMRARIRQLASSGVKVGGVEIRTLDSFAWRLRVGSTEVATNGSLSYDESIATLLKMLEQPSDGLREYLEHFQHIFIDEAQDLTGSRAQLVAALLRLLPESTGYTIFLDPAQAIYGWEDEEAGEDDWDFRALHQSLDPAPEVCSLSTLHRTRDPDLRQLLLASRKLMLDDQEPDRDRRLRAELARRTSIPKQGFGECMKALKPLVEGQPDTFLLFRTRAEALEASSWLVGTLGVQHRLRFGALPQVAAPWLSIVINMLWAAYMRPRVTRQEFEGRWAMLGDSWAAREWTAEAAWQTMRRMGPVQGQKTLLDLAGVADRLAMSQLPDELFLKDVGPGGPIVGTIHGSKGREAATVVMTLREDEPADPERGLYEGRVLYVALSRAKERLHIAQLGRPHWSYLHSRRIWSFKNRTSKALCLEVGRDGDIDVAWNASVLDARQFQRQQQRLESFDGSIIDLTGWAQAQDDWRFYLTDARSQGEDRTILGVLSSAVQQDMWEAIRTVNERTGQEPLRPGGPMGFVRWFDVTSVAVTRDHKLPPNLPEPWRSSRVWLSPVVSGLGRIPLKPGRQNG